MSPGELSRHRQTSLATLQAASIACATRSAELLASAPEHCRQVLEAAGSGPNLGLVEWLVEHMDWHDKSLVHDLVHGFPLVGDIPVCLDAPLGTRRLQTVSIDDLWSRGTSQSPSQLERHNRPLPPGSEAQADSAELWRQTLAEQALRRMDLVPPETPWEGPLTRRFAVRQLTSDGRSKVRGIDDFHESLVNDSCSVKRRIRMGRLSDLHYSASVLRNSQPDVDLALLKSDFKAAYRGCPILSDHLRLSTILVQEPMVDGSSRCHRFRQLAMPFGAVAAVYAWDRLGAFLAAVLSDFLLIPASRYVDDLFLVDYSECAAATRLIMLEVVDMLGFTLEEEKTPPPASSQDILGIRVDLTADSLLLSPEPRKVALWISSLKAALASSSLSIPSAMKLAGRLNFAASAAWGSIARSRLRRLYRHIHLGHPLVQDDLAGDLSWWILRLERLEPHRLFLHIVDPVILYTDAEGSGGLGGVIDVDNTASWFSASTPDSVTSAMLPRKTQIFPLEVLAVAAALRLWKDKVSGRHLVVFVDNTSALAALRKGSSKVSDVHGLIALTWQQLLSSVSSVKFFWVPSKLNLSDLPSRGLTPIVGSKECSRIRWETFEHALASRWL